MSETLTRADRCLAEINHEIDDIGIRLDGVGGSIGFLERVIKGDVFASQTLLNFQNALRDCAYNFHAIDIENRHIGKLIGKLEKAGPKVEIGAEKRVSQTRELASLNKRYHTLMVDLLGSVSSKVFGEGYSKIPDAIRSGLISPDQANRFYELTRDAETRIKNVEKLLSIDDVFFGDLGSFHPKLERRFLTLGETAHLLTTAYRERVPSGEKENDLLGEYRVMAPKPNVRDGAYTGIKPSQDKVQFGDVEVSVKSIRIDKVAVYPQKTDAVLNSLEEVRERIMGHKTQIHELSTCYDDIMRERDEVKKQFGQYIGGLKINELITYQDTVGYEKTVSEIDGLLDKNQWLKTEEESDCLKYRSFRDKWSSIR